MATAFSDTLSPPFSANGRFSEITVVYAPERPNRWLVDIEKRYRFRYIPGGQD
jgi:hypothetical protein